MSPLLFSSNQESLRAVMPELSYSLSFRVKNLLLLSSQKCYVQSGTTKAIYVYVRINFQARAKLFMWKIAKASYF